MSHDYVMSSQKLHENVEIFCEFEKKKVITLNKCSPLITSNEPWYSKSPSSFTVIHRIWAASRPYSTHQPHSDHTIFPSTFLRNNIEVGQYALALPCFRSNMLLRSRISRERISGKCGNTKLRQTTHAHTKHRINFHGKLYVWNASPKFWKQSALTDTNIKLFIQRNFVCVCSCVWQT